MKQTRCLNKPYRRVLSTQGTKWWPGQLHIACVYTGKLFEAQEQHGVFGGGSVAKGSASYCGF